MIFKPMTTLQELEWIRERTHVVPTIDSMGLVAYQDETIVAMCLADTFTVDSCSVHLGIDNPLVLRHGFLEELADWLFVQCGRKRLFGLVPDNNEKALKMNLHIGWREVTRIPDVLCEGVGTVVMRMDKEDCRWLKKREAA